MLEFIFTLDYEIYGNGQGSLRDLIYEPAQRLMKIFRKYQARCVIFVEVAELEMIEVNGSDSVIDLVKQQIRDLYNSGFEIGLHLHPQWYNARFENGEWQLDYSEYNLCTRPQERIVQIVDRAIAYLRKILGEPDFTPFSFRAGNWLLQPSETAANVLSERGIRVDSSVFKGGRQNQHRLDYRRSLRNGYYWMFSDDVNVPDSQGRLLELPIHTRMIPTWRMFTAKRIKRQRKGASTAQNSTNNNRQNRFCRLMDFMRFQYPLKLDFCLMTKNEFTNIMNAVIRDDKRNPSTYRPLVAIGHTKDFFDFETLDASLAYLKKNNVPVTTFKEAYKKIAVNRQL
jgi:peptidoglycan/xylan/chitin deacetylase (PgdA/CDA1 family)